MNLIWVEMLNFNTELKQVKTLPDIAKHCIYPHGARHQLHSHMEWQLRQSALKNMRQVSLPDAIPLIKIYLFKASELVRPSSAAGLLEFHNDTGWNGKYSQTMQLWEFPSPPPLSSLYIPSSRHRVIIEQLAASKQMRICALPPPTDPLHATHLS